MESYLTLIFLLALCHYMHVCTGTSDPPNVQLNDDVLGLIVFKSDVEDPFSHLQSWNEDDNSPCAWKYITCNPDNGRVSQLSLDGLGLSGKLGRGLEKLQRLKVLSLAYNNLTGQLPDLITSTSTLESLNLTHNNLSGPIPSSLLVSTLKFLDLSQNSLSGSLPDHFFQNCVSLRYLSLAGNMLQGPISSTTLQLGRCLSLNHLNLSGNHFAGEPDFSSGVWSLRRLRTLDLSFNAFSGSIPQGVLGLHNLKQLLLQGNQFSGPIPGDVGLCPHLNRLDLNGNLFTGALPDSLSMLKSLSFISLSNNMLTGEFPVWLSNLTTLEYVDFSNNALTGTLPTSIGDLKSLKHLSLSNNRLTANIPNSLVYCTKLEVIRLRGNSFNGSIPEGLFELGLEEVDFSQNGFMGSIPSGSGRLFESLTILDLSSNNLTGKFPAEIGLFAHLKYLNLSWNNLESSMPPEIGYLQSLKELDLRNNELHGSIPGDICESASLDILQLDGNSLSGPIPEEVGNCSSLYLLSLSHNNLTGSIPKSISKLNKLKILKLESNELGGEIPQELGKMESLVAVNVSYNRLIGRLPVGGVFPSLDQSALQGNLGLCSPLLKGPCKMNVPKPLVLDPDAYYKHRQRNEPSDSANSRRDHRMFLSVSSIAAIAAAILIAFGVIVISLLNVSARRRLTFVDTALESMCSSSSKSASPATGKLVLFDSRSSPDWNINPETLLQKASEIGEGVFGTVYKVSLGTSQPNIVAIKKLVTSNIIQNPGDFEREVGVLGKARHPNLISLEGYYWTPQLQLLVSEYAPNGSLQAKLHERLPSAPLLTWLQRFKIILGTAKGLAHLHHSFRPPIIHYNIKPSNILLDENYNPKISDFGLARLVTRLDKHVLNHRFQSAIGYVAPELSCQSLRVNEKCDIYGFGVLILEVVTGRRPVEYGEDNVVILSDHVRVSLEEGNVLECVDQSMGDFPEDEVLPVLKLALVCTSQIPSNRPSMPEVVQILQVIKTPLPQRKENFASF